MAPSLFEEIGLDKVSEIMAAATVKAAKKADQLGLPHAEEINGKWGFRYPDGSSKPFITKGNVQVAEALTPTCSQIELPNELEPQPSPTRRRRITGHR